MLPFHSHWRLDHCGIGFGHCLWCNVVVDAAIPAAIPAASLQADDNLTETNGARDLISFDSNEMPTSATGKEDMFQLERQLSEESFEAITASEMGGKTVNQSTVLVLVNVWLVLWLPARFLMSVVRP